MAINYNGFHHESTKIQKSSYKIIIRRNINDNRSFRQQTDLFTISKKLRFIKTRRSIYRSGYKI